MSFVTVFCWPAYVKTEGPEPSVLRLNIIWGYNKAEYRRDAGDWTITIKHDEQGKLSTVNTGYRRWNGEPGTICGDDIPVVPATWEEHQASNGQWARPCDISCIRGTL